MAAPATTRIAISQAARRPSLRHGMLAVLLATDAVALSVAVLGAFRMWTIVNPKIPPANAVVELAPAFCIAMFASTGLYPGIGLTAVEYLRRMFRAVTLMYLVFTAAMFLSKDYRADSRGAFVASWIFSLALVPLGRFACQFFLARRSWWGVPVMVLGAGATARRVIHNLEANQILGYRPVVCVDDDPSRQGDCEGVPVPGGLRDARTLALQYGTSYAIVAMPSIPRPSLLQYLHEWSSIFENVIIIPDLLGVASLFTEPRDLGGVLGLEIRHNLLRRRSRWIKRAVDVALGGTGLLLSAPLLAVAAIWIKRVSPGPAFYFHERDGANGKPLRIVKLRTMYVDAERALQRYLEEDHSAKDEWERFHKLKHDPRILPGIGHLLRKSSLDEVPQLWNVLKGEMSLVGPRPFPSSHNQRFTAEFRTLRTQVTPGLTGMWQVSARSNGGLEVQEAYDRYYIRNWSVWLDIYILVRTFRAVLAGEGAY